MVLVKRINFYILRVKGLTLEQCSNVNQWLKSKEKKIPTVLSSNSGVHFFSCSNNSKYSWTSPAFPQASQNASWRSVKFRMATDTDNNTSTAHLASERPCGKLQERVKTIKVSSSCSKTNHERASQSYKFARLPNEVRTQRCNL